MGHHMTHAQLDSFKYSYPILIIYTNYMGSKDYSYAIIIIIIMCKVKWFLVFLILWISIDIWFQVFLSNDNNFSNRSICPIDGILTSMTTSYQSGLRRLPNPNSSRIAGSPPSGVECHTSDTNGIFKAPPPKTQREKKINWKDWLPPKNDTCTGK